MRLVKAVLLAAAAVMLSAASCSQTISDLTGTTLEERCDGYRTSLAGLDLIRDRDLTEDEADRREGYQFFVDTFCPPERPET